MLNFITQPPTSQYVIAFAFMLTGTLHFVKPGIFISIMPEYIPWHGAMVYISGAAEMAGAAGILIPQTRPAAAYGLILLLIAVFPANIDMAVKAVKYKGWLSLYSIVTLLRLPLQFVLIYWVYWACIE